jgi:glycosyltransferase involved in cell wall biosynthesis
MISAIHQYTPDIAPADGVSSSLFFVRKILRSLGYESEIYADSIDPSMKELAHPRETYPDLGGNLLFMHHSIAQPHSSWLFSLHDRLVMVYHNITPSHYFTGGSPHWTVTEEGRRQLGLWQDRFVGVIAESNYNGRELKSLGYENVSTIPLLVDLDKLQQMKPDPEVARRHEKTFNLLFVGRIAENKCQHELIHAFAALQDDNARLFLVGGVSSPEYHTYLVELIDHYRLGQQVHLVGKVSDEELWGYYSAADLFVCLSEHEGFCIPLIEASLAGIPIVAYDSSNIRHTLSGSGLLISRKNGMDLAAVWRNLIEQPEWRIRLARSQRENLHRFSLETLTLQLQKFLAPLQPMQPELKQPSQSHRPTTIQAQEGSLPQSVAAVKKCLLTISIEGPFDSNYSLALVNRGLAQALVNRGAQVELCSTEGGGDYPPNPQFLRQHPEVAALWNSGPTKVKSDLAIRNLYPPRVTGMNGVRKVLGPYGWEESSFPQPWVDELNRRLHMVATMSDYVTRTLRNNGVRVPIVTVGIGADSLLNVPAAALPCAIPPGYTLLHISSCFPRKGVDLLLRAYAAAYTAGTAAGTEATLIIKTFTNPHNDIHQQLQAAGWVKYAPFLYRQAQGSSQKKIMLLEDDLTPAQMVSLYQHSDLLVAPSRGEGFGLPMAEAMLFNLPVLTTGYGGQRDFCTEDTAWLVDYGFVRAETHMGLSDSVWADPDPDDLLKKMNQLATLSQEEIKRKTDRARQNILANFSWNQVAKRLLAAVAGLDRQVCPRPVRRLAWVSTWNSRCGIASYSENLGSALPIEHFLVLANRSNDLTKKDAANVIRCWDTGEEDDLQRILEIIIGRQLTDVVIQFNFSFFKLESLAGLLTALHAKGIRCYLFLHSTADVKPPHEPKSLSTISPALRQVERLFVHSIQDLNNLKNCRIVDNAAIFPHGVGTQPLLARSTQDKKKSKIIATSGFILPHKGIQELIKAFEILRAEDPELKLLLLNALYPVGISEEEWCKCQVKIAQSPYRSDITMINDYLPEEEIHQKLSQAEVIVYPCQDTQESSSASVRMGLATGRPVATSPLAIFADVADVVYFLPGITPEDIAAGIKKLLADKMLCTDIKTRQQKWLASHNWQILGHRLWNIIGKSCQL